ncbi:MAG TPA: nuclear transport factor 2 family protein [Alphaproteobacteria bacterium]|nr:nuclear transport factor 2 family protein [Alphaproteobacteria bacterium]
MLDRNFFLRYYETYASEDAAALGAFYAEDVKLISGQGVIQGRDQLLETYRSITSLFRDRMTPDSILIDGDRAAVEITDRFEAKQAVPEFLGRPFAKGEAFTMRICGLYRVQDGKIREIAIYSLG